MEIQFLFNKIFLIYLESDTEAVWHRRCWRNGKCCNRNSNSNIEFSSVTNTHYNSNCISDIIMFLLCLWNGNWYSFPLLSSRLWNQWWLKRKAIFHVKVGWNYQNKFLCIILWINCFKFFRKLMKILGKKNVADEEKKNS